LYYGYIVYGLDLEIEKKRIKLAAELSWIEKDFFVRDDDRYIIGLINFKYGLNERLEIIFGTVFYPTTDNPRTVLQTVYYNTTRYGLKYKIRNTKIKKIEDFLVIINYKTSVYREYSPDRKYERKLAELSGTIITSKKITDKVSFYFGPKISFVEVDDYNPYATYWRHWIYHYISVPVYRDEFGLVIGTDIRLTEQFVFYSDIVSADFLSSNFGLVYKFN
jgi:hypothetical protein